ncbi:MAG: class I SAM-dependent methyltransferase [Marinicellaceae bacterium]
MKTKNNVSSVFNKYAQKYQDKYMDVALYKDSLDLFCKLVNPPNAKILDIGCGPGNVTQYLLNKNPQFDILGIDLAKNMIQLAQINNPEARFKVLDCRNISTIEETFDGIMCAYCLPYLNVNETEELIKEASNLLNKNGVIYLSSMQDDYANSRLQGPSSNGDEQMFMYYYQLQQLLELLNKYNLSSIKTYQLNNPQQSEPSIKDLVIIASNSN